MSQTDNIDILSHAFEQHITQTADSVSAVILNSNSLFTPRNIHKHGRSLLANAPYLRSLYVCDMAGNVISGTEEFTGILPADLNSFLPVPFSDSSIIRFGLPMKRRKSVLQLLINLSHQWRQPLNTVGLLIQKIQIEHEEGVLTQESLNASSEAVLKEIRI